MVFGSGFSSGAGGASSTPPLPMEGALPPDLQGTLIRVGPGRADGGIGAGGQRGALHAVELRDGQAVSYLRVDSPADAGVFWQAGSVLALPESGLPSRYSRLLEPEEFGGGLTVPIASHVHRVAADGTRVLFSVDDGMLAGGDTDSEPGESDIWLRLGEWDARGELRTAQAVQLERATWQHDIGVTAGHVVFIESPTRRLTAASGGGFEGDVEDAERAPAPAVPFGWVPGAQGWIGVVPRGGDGAVVRWVKVDPCLVTHVLGAWEVSPGAQPRGDVDSNGRGVLGDGGGPDGGGPDGETEIVLFVCRYDAPEVGQPIDLDVPVVGPAGIGAAPIGGGLAVLERWRLVGDRLERTQVDERGVEYPRMDAQLEGVDFRYGYAVELGWNYGSGGIDPLGLLKFDLARDETAAWAPGPLQRVSEPLFVRATDGRSDDEGWLLTVVDDPNRGASDLYVLDASTFGRRTPEAIIHLPERLPFRSHGEWVPADRYR